MKRIYVAGPYTHGDVAVNVRNAMAAGTAIIQAGHAPYVPHLSHFMHLQEPQSYDTWITMDLAWVEACDYLLRLNGHSPGADGEVAYARELGKTIFYDLNALLGALKAEL
jgi:hypothetical protein